MIIFPVSLFLSFSPLALTFRAEGSFFFFPLQICLVVLWIAAVYFSADKYNDDCEGDCACARDSTRSTLLWSGAHDG